MKKITAIILLAAMCLSLCACGGDKAKAELPVLLAENNAVKIELVDVDKKSFNLAGGKSVESFIRLKVYNKSENDISLSLDGYIGDEQVKTLFYDGMAPAPGKSAELMFVLQLGSGEPLKSPEQLYELEGRIKVYLQGTTKDYKLDFSVPAALRGEVVPEIDTEEDHRVDSIDFETENGRIKYLGVEKANEGLVSKGEAMLIKFSFENYLDKPEKSDYGFTFKFFQNGVEIDSANSYTSRGGDHFDLMSNAHKEVMKGGVIEFAEAAFHSGDGPITVMVCDRYNDDEDYQMMEIDISGALGAGSGGSEKEYGLVLDWDEYKDKVKESGVDGKLYTLEEVGYQIWIPYFLSELSETDLTDEDIDGGLIAKFGNPDVGYNVIAALMDSMGMSLKEFEYVLAEKGDPFSYILVNDAEVILSNQDGNVHTILQTQTGDFLIVAFPPLSDDYSTALFLYIMASLMPAE